MCGEKVDPEEEKKSKERAGGEHHSGPAKPVPEIAPEWLGLRGNWSVRHRGNYLPAFWKVISILPRVIAELETRPTPSRQQKSGGSPPPPKQLAQKFKRYFFKERT
jgi:hypothetical protein